MCEPKTLNKDELHFLFSTSSHRPETNQYFTLFYTDS